MAAGGGSTSILEKHRVVDISRRLVETESVVERAWANASAGMNRVNSIIRAIVVSTSTGYGDSTTHWIIHDPMTILLPSIQFRPHVLTNTLQMHSDTRVI